jgi:hypothetical protein
MTPLAYPPPPYFKSRRAGRGEFVKQFLGNCFDRRIALAAQDRVKIVGGAEAVGGPLV